MNWLDVLLGFVAVVTFLCGLGRDTAKNGLSLLITLVAVVAAGLFYTLPAGVIDLLLDENWARLVGFGGTLLLTKAAFQIPADRLLRRRLALLGPFDRPMASLMGLLEAAAWAETIGAALVAFPVLSLATVVSQSRLIQTLITSQPFILLLLPSEFQLIKQIF